MCMWRGINISFMPLLSHHVSFSQHASVYIRIRSGAYFAFVCFWRCPYDCVTAFADGMSMCSIYLTQSELGPICLPLDGSEWKRKKKDKWTCCQDGWKLIWWKVKLTGKTVCHVNTCIHCSDTPLLLRSFGGVIKSLEGSETETLHQGFIIGIQCKVWGPEVSIMDAVSRGSGLKARECIISQPQSLYRALACKDGLLNGPYQAQAHGPKVSGAILAFIRKMSLKLIRADQEEPQNDPRETWTNY